MSQQYKPKVSNHNGDNPVRRPIKAHDLKPGCIVWLPASTIERRKMIPQLKVHCADGEALSLKAYNHPVVVLKIINLPSGNSTSGNSNRDVFAIVAMLTSFGCTGGYEDTCRLGNRHESLWDSYLAIHPSTHPSNTDVLYLQKGRLEKPSYVELKGIYLPISALQIYTKGRSATASDVRLKSHSLGVLLRKLKMRRPESLEQGPGVARRTTAIPSSPSLSILSPGTLSASNCMPYRPQVSVREDTLSVTNTVRLSRPFLISYSRSNYGSTDNWSLPPPITSSHRGRTSNVSRSFSSMGRGIFLPSLKVITCLLLVGFIVLYAPALIGRIFTKIGHFLTSIWSSCWGFIAHGWRSFVGFLGNNWHVFIAWLKSLIGK